MGSQKDKIKTILSEYSNLPKSDITEKDSLDNLGIDSLSLVEIIFDLEEEFDVRVPEEAALTDMGLTMTKVNDIDQLITVLLAQEASNE